MMAGTDLETTERYTGCGQVTGTVRIEDTRGQGHAIEVTVYGWNVLHVIEAVTKSPLAVNVGQIQEPDTHWTRALVTQARANLAGYARLHKVVFAKGFLAGTALWWLDHQGLGWVVPAKANMAVTADARRKRQPARDLAVAAGCTRSVMDRVEPPGPTGWRPRSWA